MRKQSQWLRQNLTATQYVEGIVEAQGSMIAVDRLAGLCNGHIKVWLGNPERQLSKDSMEKLRSAYGIPVAALIFRHVPIRQVMKAELHSAIWRLS